MRLWNWLISVLLHVAVIAMAVFLPYILPSAPVVDLNRQVMDLLLTSTPPAPGPIAPTDPTLESTGKAADQDGAPPVEEIPEPEPPKPEPPKPEPPKPEPPKPEPPKPEEKEISPTKKPEEKKPEEKKPEEKKPEEKKPEKKEPSRKEILDAALKDAQKEAAKAKNAADSERQTVERELAALRQNTPGPPGQAGGLGGAGPGGTGGSGAATLSDIYSQQVGALIKRNWRYPPPATKDNVACQVEVVIAVNGEISNFELIRPSGRPDFDGSALKAVAMTKTLPPPPSKTETRIVVTFNLQELAR